VARGGNFTGPAKHYVCARLSQLLFGSSSRPVLLRQAKAANVLDEAAVHAFQVPKPDARINLAGCITQVTG
jgi:hypothetical protein